MSSLQKESRWKKDNEKE